MKKNIIDLLQKMSEKAHTRPDYYQTLFDNLGRCHDKEDACLDKNALELDENEIAIIRKVYGYSKGE